MLNITEEAKKRLGDVGGPENAGTPIRIAVMGSGATNCGLGLMTDELSTEDLTFPAGEHTVIIDKKLMDYCQEITLDFTQGEPDRCDSLSKRGFLINARNSISL